MKNRTRTCLSILLFFIVGCGTMENVSDVEYASHDRFVEHLRVDSVFMHDSIYVREKSDTVYYTKYRTVYKERLRVDTIVRCDTLYRDREVVVERVRDYGNKISLLWKLPVVLLLVLLLWRTGLWRVIWNLILKGVELCIRIFRLKA